MHEGGLTRVATYERTVPTSAERVWENVRDWEHLPWLHSSSFSSIDCVDEGEWGWRAKIGLPGGDRHILLELVIEPDEPRYVSRTLEGGGAGAEIWTRVTARSEKETDIAVEFWLPDVTEDRVEALGDVFVKLYTRLWDEDESMMVRRADELAHRRAERAGEALTVSLGTLEELRPDLPLRVRFGGDPFRVIEHEGVLIAHSVVCPHLLGPLDEAPVDDGRVVCPWHGYAFDVKTGRQCSGRGGRMKLATPPVVSVDPETKQVWLAPGLRTAG
jgi:nitrite reductase/ring-hydroxylating ferredoxin subunit